MCINVRYFFLLNRHNIQQSLLDNLEYFSWKLDKTIFLGKILTTTKTVRFMELKTKMRW